MKLYYYCSSCQKENSFKTKATNRFELQEERGNHINERCKKCGTIVKRRINRVHARANKSYVLLSFGLCIFLTLLLWELGWVATLTFTIPIMIWRSADIQASKFNKVMVDDNE